VKSVVIYVLILVGVLSAFAAGQKQQISVRGSDAMIMLAQRWSEMLKTVRPDVSLSVNGGGPAGGMNSLASGHADVAQLPHKLSNAERQAIEKSRGSSVVEFPVAIESVVVYVHKSNPVSVLTLGQLRAIYTGKIGNWKEVGGKDAPIARISTETAVGGSLFFRETVLGGEEFDDVMRGYTNSKQMFTALGLEPNGIGFGSLATEPNVKALRLKKDLNFPAVEATADNIRTMQYPTSRFLYWVVPAGMGPSLREVSNWVLSQQGQLVVESAGYFPLNAADRSKATGLIHEAH